MNVKSGEDFHSAQVVNPTTGRPRYARELRSFTPNKQTEIDAKYGAGEKTS